MANAYVRSSGILRLGSKWSVVINGNIVERNIGNEEAARAACLWWEVNYREEERELPEATDTVLGEGRR